MKVTPILVLVVASLGAYAQNDPEVVAFFDKNWKRTTIVSEAHYYRTIVEASDKYIVTDYYGSNDQMEMQAICSSYEPFLNFDGSATWYYEDGTLKKEATYRENDLVGVCKTYYSTGKPHTFEIFENGLGKYCQYWTTEGEPVLDNGTGLIIEQYPEESATAYREVLDSLTVATFTVSWNTQDTVYGITTKRADYKKGGLKSFYKELSKVIRYPKEARKKGIQGRVFISFIVDKSGVPVDVKVVKGIGGGCDEEALRAFNTLVEWNPAEYKGKPVKVSMVLPIIFKLG